MRLLHAFPVALAAAALAASLACRSSSHDEPETKAMKKDESPVAAQVARGGEVFGMHCARCHGDAGQGTKKAPPLVGSGALPLEPRPGAKRAARFHTALDVAQFVTTNMPPDAELRAKLVEEQYWAVLAFALSANGVKLTAPVGPSNAAQIVLHP